MPPVADAGEPRIAGYDAAVEIRTKRLRLRPIAVEDADGYGRLLSDPRVHPFVIEDGPVLGEAVVPRIRDKERRWAEGDSATWAVLRDESFVGYVALHGLGSPRVAISYALLPEAQRLGYGREAVAAVLQRVGDFGVQEVEAQVHFGNEASVRLLLALGFTEIDPIANPPRRVFQWQAPS